MRMKSYKTSFVASFVALIVWVGCADTGADPDTELTVNQKVAIQYFKDIALGFEFGSASEVTRKWNRDINLFVTGEPTDLLLDELDRILEDLNRLIPDSGPRLRITEESARGNLNVFLGKGEEYAQMNSSAANRVGANYGLFFVNFNSQNYITSATMYVDTERATDIQQRHLLREELTQALGLAKDSPRYPDSIFSDSFGGVVTEYNRFDEAVIRMLYHPKMATGLDESAVDPILREIVPEVIE